MNSILRLAGFNLNPIRQIEDIGMHLSWGWAALVLILIFVIPVAWYSYRLEGRQINNRRQSQLLSIRLIWLILVAFLLSGPMLVVSGYIPQRNRLVVMVDTSRSMSIGKSGESRIDQVKKLFAGGFINRLEAKTGIYPDVFAFSDNVSPLSKQEVDQLQFSADGSHTDISGAVRDVAGNLGEGSLLGIVMITDGVSTKGENPLVALSGSRTPVHFIAPAGSGQTADMALHLVRPPATGYLNSSVRVRGEVSVHGIATDSVSINIMRDGKPFAVAKAEFTGENAERAGFAFNIPCDEEGSFRFDLEIAQADNELTNENNRAGFLLKVVRERLNVFALSGRPSWDMKFITNALSTDPNARLVHWLRIKDDRWICSREFKVEPGVRQPEIAADLSSADVIILSGADYNMLKPVEAEIVRRVEAGLAGLLVLPSSKSLNELGYRGTEIEKLLPVNLEKEFWRGNPGNLALPATEVSLNFLRLVDNPIENVEFFATLPKIDGAYEYAGLKAGAEVLVSSTIRGNSDVLPFMVRTRTGLGNTILISGGPIWPAGFRLVQTDRGFSPYSALIVNMCKWLANRREDSQVSVELASSRGYTGQANSIKVWVTDSKHQLQPNAQVSISVTDEKQNTSSLPAVETSERGCYEASFVPAFRGLHKISAEARYQGRELGKAEAEMLVEVPTAEFDEPVIKDALMTQLASETTGIFTTIEGSEKIISAIDAVPGQKLESRTVDLRDSWILLLIILVMPMIEWYLRRTGGLS